MIIEIDIAFIGGSTAAKKKDRYSIEQKGHLFRQISTRDMSAVYR